MAEPPSRDCLSYLILSGWTAEGANPEASPEREKEELSLIGGSACLWNEVPAEIHLVALFGIF